jgi:hypothetical protein
MHAYLWEISIIILVKGKILRFKLIMIIIELIFILIMKDSRDLIKLSKVLIFRNNLICLNFIKVICFCKNS